MGKIYVLESGCKYEGGSAFAASTSLTRAWKLLRERRIEGERIDGHGRKQVVRLVGKLAWASDYDYFCIRVYEDA